MEENKLIALLNKHWSKCLLLLLAIACIAVWTERYFRSNQQKSRLDFIAAHQIFERFQKGEFFDNESLINAEHILQRHPELHPKYDPLLALTYLAQHQVHEAKNYAMSTIMRASKQLPGFFKEYAQASLMIADENYSEAWNAALALDQKIHNSTRLHGFRWHE